jgi:hypothetical protein
MYRLWLTRTLGSLCVILALAGCSAASKQGAGQGAKAGAVGGLVAGAVGSIFWGGDAVNNALRTAAVGAASGAAVGAMTGGGSSKGAPAPNPGPGGAAGQTVDPSAADQALKARIGDLNYAAGEELAHCRHVTAIARAEKAFASETDAQRKGYALLLQAMAAEESGNTTRASAVYAHWGQFDPARADADRARSEALEGLLNLQKVRQQHGLPVLCT